MTGYVDIQVNGYGGVNYNDDALTPEAFHASCERLQNDGVAGILATICSDQPDAMIRRMQKIVQLRAADPLAKKIVWGIHIEGPYLSPEGGYRGAHPAEAMKPANLDTIKKFCSACDGLLRVLTLAPEMDTSGESTRWLAAQRVTVSGGHSNASLDQLKSAIDAGLSLWTHLGNGAPAHMHRHDNIIQRVLSLSDKLRICFIGDGVHIPLFALKNYLKAADPARAIIVTDAVWPAGLGPGTFDMGPRWGKVVVGEDLAIRAPDKSHFLGSACTMPQCEANLSEGLGLPETDVRKMLCDHPAQIARGVLS